MPGVGSDLKVSPEDWRQILGEREAACGWGSWEVTQAETWGPPAHFTTLIPNQSCTEGPLGSLARLSALFDPAPAASQAILDLLKAQVSQITPLL